MNQVYAYGRDLDLNLLRVFVVVAETGSVTAAAARLYLTQPAISAALKRLTTAIGVPLFARHGRGITLTPRGEQLLADVRPHLGALVDAAFAPVAFDPLTSDRTFRLGLSDASESWLLPSLVRNLGRAAPRMRIISVGVQFRTVADALTSQRVDMAVTVADEMPAGIRRHTLFTGGFVCLFDPRHTRLLGPKASPERALADYLAHEHVVVSYNGDLRGVVEDVLGLQRKVRCSVSSFQGVGALVEGGPLVATLPRSVVTEILRVRPKLAVAPTPFKLGGTPMELLWRTALDDDAASAFLREQIARIATHVAG